MIIEVRSQMQSLSSNTGRKLQDEEIIWRLNTAVDKIIKDSVSELIGEHTNFSVDSVHYQKIANLIVLGESWPIRENPTDSRGAYLVPKSNCKYVLSAEALATTNCKDSPVPKLTTVHTSKIVFPDEASYDSLKFSVNGSILFDSRAMGTVTTAGKFALINQLIQALEVYGYSAYWKISPSESSPNTLFINSTVSPITESSLTYKVGLTEKRTEGFNSNITYNWTEYPTCITKRIPVIVKDPGYRSIILSNPFHKPSKDSGIMFWSPFKPEVFYPLGVIYNAVELTYVRKSKIISLLLNENSDLTDHQEVCDVAVQLIMKDTQNAGYPVQAEYNKGTN